MSLLTTMLLTTLEFEDDDLFVATLRDNFSLDLGAINERRTKFWFVSADEENFVEVDFVAGSALDLFNSDQVALLDAILLAAGADYCVSHGKGRES